MPCHYVAGRTLSLWLICRAMLESASQPGCVLCHVQVSAWEMQGMASHTKYALSPTYLRTHRLYVCIPRLSRHAGALHHNSDPSFPGMYGHTGKETARIDTLPKEMPVTYMSRKDENKIGMFTNHQEHEAVFCVLVNS
eukprot:11480-Chlamydomonas_euryale.AAC.2